MATYIMLTRLTDKGAETIKENPARIEAVAKELEGFGVKVVAQYAVLGPFDFVNVIEAPDNMTVARISVWTWRSTVGLAVPPSSSPQTKVTSEPTVACSGSRIASVSIWPSFAL